MQQKKRSQDMTNKHTTKSRQKLGRQFYSKKNIYRLRKKQDLLRFTQDLCHPKQNSYLQAKVAGNAKKFQFIINQDTSDSNDSVKHVGITEKILFSSLITLVNRKRNQFLTSKNTYLRFWLQPPFECLKWPNSVHLKLTLFSETQFTKTYLQ